MRSNARNMASIAAYIALCAWVFCTSLHAQTLCGATSAPENIDIQGATFFQPEDILDTLKRDITFQVKGHPRAPYQNFADYLRRAILSGYARRGFADCRVVVGQNEAGRGTVVRIHEGTRYTAGAIHVTGTTLITPEQVSEELSKELAKKEEEEDEQSLKEPVSDFNNFLKAFSKSLDGLPSNVLGRSSQSLWQAGQPAAVDQVNLAGISIRVTHMLEGLGQWSPSVTAKCANQPDGTVELEIRVLDEGVKTFIRDIDIQGTQVVPVQEILDLIGDQRDQPLSFALITRLTNQLNETGRFPNIQIAPRKTDDPAKMDILIKVAEGPWTRPLSEKDDDILLAFKAMRKSLIENRFLPGDLAISFTDHGKNPEDEFQPLAEVHAVIRPGVGIILRWQDPSLATSDTLQWASSGSLLLSNDSVSFVRDDTHIIIESPLPHNLVWELDLLPGKNFQKDPLSCKLGLQWGSASVENIFDVNVSPCVPNIMALKLRPYKVPADEPYLIMASEDQLTLTMTKNTGEFISLLSPNFRAVVEEDAYDKAYRGLLEQTKDYEHLPVNSELLVRSCLRLLFGEEKDTSRIENSILNLIQTMKPHVNQLIEGLNSKDDGFEVCLPFTLTGAGIPAMIGTYLPALAECFFPRDTWPWVVLRETGLILLDKAENTSAEIARLLDDPRTGPYGHLTIAFGLKYLGNDQAASFVAQRGLMACTPERFIAEMEPLFVEGTLAGDMSLAFARAVQDLRREDWELIAERIENEEYREGIMLFANAILNAKETDPSDMRRILLRTIWDNILATQVESQLSVLAEPQAVLDGTGQ